MSPNLKRKASIDEETEDKPMKRVAQGDSEGEDSDDGLQVRTL